MLYFAFVIDSNTCSFRRRNATEGKGGGWGRISSDVDVSRASSTVASMTPTPALSKMSS